MPLIFIVKPYDISYKIAVLITPGRDIVSRVVQSLIMQIDKGASTSPVSVVVYKMKHEINEYLRRKEIRRVLSKLPVKHIGMAIEICNICMIFKSYLHPSLWWTTSIIFYSVWDKIQMPDGQCL